MHARPHARQQDAPLLLLLLLLPLAVALVR
jgi:hypothetical protein